MRFWYLAGFLLALLASFNPLLVRGQKVLPYARRIVDTLSAPGMHGRGYVANGHVKAAQYIAGEFKKLGLKSFGNGYFQEFPISINTFPENIFLKLGDKLLEPGKDYLVAPCSRSYSGKVAVMPLPDAAIKDPQVLLSQLQQAQGKALLIDKTRYSNASKDEKQKLEEVIAFLRSFKNNPAVATLILTDEKLTWHTAQQTCERPQLIINKSVAPSSFKKVELDIQSKHLSGLTTQNVLGFLEGKNPGKGVLVISAHYDHLGRLGSSAYFPGANDNASGIAMLITLAKHLSQPQHKPEHDILFAAFGAEEVGLLGSRYFVQHPVLPLKNIHFLINLDITGTGEEGIKVVNGKIFEEQFKLLKSLNDERQLLKAVSPRGEACNSDHCPFYEQGVPSFFIYTLGGIQAYHDVHDKSETLPLTEFEDLHSLLLEFIRIIALKY